MGKNGFLLTNSQPSTLVRNITPYFFNSIKRYSRSKGDHGPMIEEKAPSLADEFKRVAEEKAKAAEEAHQPKEQGIASQTSDKMSDGGEEATTNKHGEDSVKGKYNEHDSDADYRRKG